MLIPVAHLSKYGIIAGSILFDTNTIDFLDSNTIYERKLPIQDYNDCSVRNDNICTIVGMIQLRKTYVVCFGDNFCYEVDKEYLSSKVLSNAVISADNSFQCLDGSFEDLGYLFPDPGIKYISEFYGKNVSSKGIARKFSALYDNALSIVKFSKSNNQDLKNEIIYKNIADLLGVRCCKVYYTHYFNRDCIVSVFEYSDDDVYLSFKNLNKSVSEIVVRLNKQDQVMFDKYMLLDYILLEQDRHLSNLAVVNDRLYPLFDNGECLGLGPVSHYSSEFRKYIERLNKDYRRSLFQPDEVIYSYLDDNQKALVRREVSRIW